MLHILFTQYLILSTSYFSAPSRTRMSKQVGSFLLFPSSCFPTDFLLMISIEFQAPGSLEILPSTPLPSPQPPPPSTLHTHINWNNKTFFHWPNNKHFIIVALCEHLHDQFVQCTVLLKHAYTCKSAIQWWNVTTPEGQRHPYL